MRELKSFRNGKVRLYSNYGVLTLNHADINNCTMTFVKPWYALYYYSQAVAKEMKYFS